MCTNYMYTVNACTFYYHATCIMFSHKINNARVVKVVTVVDLQYWTIGDEKVTTHFTLYRQLQCTGIIAVQDR